MSLKKTVTPPGTDPGTVRLVAQHLKHYATPGITGNNYKITKTEQFHKKLDDNPDFS
jgi:hypothetical protein